MSTTELPGVPAQDTFEQVRRAHAATYADMMRRRAAGERVGLREYFGIPDDHPARASMPENRKHYAGRAILFGDLLREAGGSTIEFRMRRGRTMARNLWERYDVLRVLGYEVDTDWEPVRTWVWVQARRHQDDTLIAMRCDELSIVHVVRKPGALPSSSSPDLLSDAG